MEKLWNTTTSLFSKYIYEPVSGVLDFALYTKSDPTGNVGAGSPVTIGSLAKDFAGGFLGTMIGKSGSKAQPYRPVEMPTPPRVNTPSSSTGNINFNPTAVDLARNFGLTRAVKQNLAKAAYSEVPAIKNIVDTIVRSASRKSGVRTRLGNQTVGSLSTKTSMPYSRKPKYFGGS